MKYIPIEQTGYIGIEGAKQDLRSSYRMSLQSQCSCCALKRKEF